MPRRENTRTSTTVPVTPGGTLSEVSRTSAAFSPKIARSSFSGVIGVSPLGVTLPTRMSPAWTSAPMYTIPASSRLRRLSSPTFGMSRVIDSGPSLVSRAITSNSSMWIEVNTSRTMRSEIRIELEVVAVPGHERDQGVAAERQLAEVGARAVGDDVLGIDLVADLHHGALVDAGVLVGPLELAQIVDVDHRVRALGLVGDPDHDARGVDLIDHAAAPGDHRRAGILGDHRLHAGADQRRLALDQRHRLALHVGAHERAVGVVVLEERDQRRRHRHQLLGRDVDEVDGLRPRQDEVAVLAAAHQILDEAPLLRQLGVGLRDGVAALLHRREIDHLVAHLAVDHPPVQALDEAVLVDPGIGRQAVDQADVGPFGVSIGQIRP